MGANALNLTALIAVVGKPAFPFAMSSTSKIVHCDAAIAESQKKRLISQLHSAEKVSAVGFLRRSLTYTYTALGHALIATDPLPHRCVYPTASRPAKV